MNFREVVLCNDRKPQRSKEEQALHNLFKTYLFTSFCYVGLLHYTTQNRYSEIFPCHVLLLVLKRQGPAPANKQHWQKKDFPLHALKNSRRIAGTSTESGQEHQTWQNGGEAMEGEGFATEI